VRTPADDQDCASSAIYPCPPDRDDHSCRGPSAASGRH
jgi:hypothetical protein